MWHAGGDGNTRTEDGIDDMIRSTQGRWEIIDELHFEILQLFCQPLRKRSAVSTGTMASRGSNTCFYSGRLHDVHAMLLEPLKMTENTKKAMRNTTLARLEY
jgi:hypothetical protein